MRNTVAARILILAWWAAGSRWELGGRVWSDRVSFAESAPSTDEARPSTCRRCFLVEVQLVARRCEGVDVCP
ncbi:hypothetical protein DFH09DRAFT_1200279 [Mycena vulgaris]|nr:hypothetical protein DFH09DRAFT_1200279 [Mycena vulgaris]